MSTKAGAASVPMTWIINDNSSFTSGTGVHLGMNIKVVSALPIELTYFKGQAIKTGSWPPFTKNAHHKQGERHFRIWCLLS